MSHRLTSELACLAVSATDHSRNHYISWTALAMMTVGSVGYLGSVPTLAVLGLASVLLYVLPAFVFLLPVSLVAAGWSGNLQRVVWFLCGNQLVDQSLKHGVDSDASQCFDRRSPKLPSGDESAAQ
jgi:hypothetical protein